MASIIDLKRRSEIEAEARAWIVQLDGKPPSKEDLAALREWASRSPQHFAALRELAELWDELCAMSTVRELLEERSRAHAGASRGGRARRLRAARPAFVFGAVAAVFALAVAVATATLMGDVLGHGAHQAVHATEIGEQHRVALPDGSSIRVNTDSVLEVSLDRRERRVRLVRGEALFEVAPDARRPFSVHAGGSAVRALGTVFAVRIEPEQVDVVVSEGAVEVLVDADDEPSESGERGTIVRERQTAMLADGVPTVRSLDERELERMLAWRDGVLVFEGEPLSDVLAEVGRYTSTVFIIDDPELRDLRIGGRFGVGETDALLEALESGFEVSVMREGKAEVRLSSARPS